MTWDEIGYAVLLAGICGPMVAIVIFDVVALFRGPRSLFRRRGS